jgi:hypothetical protein
MKRLLIAALVLTASPATAEQATQQAFSLDSTSCPSGYLAYLQTLEDDGYHFTAKGTYERALRLYQERLAKPNPPLEHPIIRCDPPEPIRFGSRD